MKIIHKTIEGSSDKSSKARIIQQAQHPQSGKGMQSLCGIDLFIVSGKIPTDFKGLWSSPACSNELMFRLEHLPNGIAVAAAESWALLQGWALPRCPKENLISLENLASPRECSSHWILGSSQILILCEHHMDDIGLFLSTKHHWRWCFWNMQKA